MKTSGTSSLLLKATSFAFAMSILGTSSIELRAQPFSARETILEQRVNVSQMKTLFSQRVSSESSNTVKDARGLIYTNMSLPEMPAITTSTLVSKGIYLDDAGDVRRVRNSQNAFIDLLGDPYPSSLDLRADMTYIWKLSAQRVSELRGMGLDVITDGSGIVQSITVNNSASPQVRDGFLMVMPSGTGLGNGTALSINSPNNSVGITSPGGVLSIGSNGGGMGAGGINGGGNGFGLSGGGTGGAGTGGVIGTISGNDIANAYARLLGGSGGANGTGMGAGSGAPNGGWSISGPGAGNGAGMGSGSGSGAPSGGWMISGPGAGNGAGNGASNGTGMGPGSGAPSGGWSISGPGGGSGQPGFNQGGAPSFNWNGSGPSTGANPGMNINIQNPQGNGGGMIVGGTPNDVSGAYARLLGGSGGTGTGGTGAGGGSGAPNGGWSISGPGGGSGQPGFNQGGAPSFNWNGSGPSTGANPGMNINIQNPQGNGGGNFAVGGAPNDVAGAYARLLGGASGSATPGAGFSNGTTGANGSNGGMNTGGINAGSGGFNGGGSGSPVFMGGGNGFWINSGNTGVANYSQMIAQQIEPAIMQNTFSSNRLQDLGFKMNILDAVYMNLSNETVMKDKIKNLENIEKGRGHISMDINGIRYAMTEVADGDFDFFSPENWVITRQYKAADGSTQYRLVSDAEHLLFVETAKARLEDAKARSNKDETKDWEKLLGNLKHRDSLTPNKEYYQDVRDESIDAKYSYRAPAGMGFSFNIGGNGGITVASGVQQPSVVQSSGGLAPAPSTGGMTWAPSNGGTGSSVNSGLSPDLLSRLIQLHMQKFPQSMSDADRIKAVNDWLKDIQAGRASTGDTSLDAQIRNLPSTSTGVITPAPSTGGSASVAVPSALTKGYTLVPAGQDASGNQLYQLTTFDVNPATGVRYNQQRSIVTEDQVEMGPDGKLRLKDGVTAGSPISSTPSPVAPAPAGGLPNANVTASEIIQMTERKKLSDGNVIIQVRDVGGAALETKDVEQWLNTRGSDLRPAANLRAGTDSK